ncbi:putative phloem protein [Rosa chinensis]|uniref:Putative phloem protein n=1 Tax=Rosa chinensis TaxID=74649 RepID=A0A2P6R577_ROSCH|nr:putative F-box protein PP2-B12 [Rosa chinensis]PRQ41595.1 putative phloem protein [Rosa chinensis]
MQQRQLDLQALPEGCIANVISLTSPPDACRLSLLSKIIRSAAESDAVWDKFIPPETQTILSQPNSLSFPSRSKKDLYMALCDNPVLINEGNMSFSLDKWSGKKCYMIASKGLRIAWGDTPRYWEWISLPESRFEEVAKLRVVGWFEIRGRIATRMLSPSTLYKAYLVYKFNERPWTFDNHPTAVAVSARSYGFDYECPSLSEMVEGGELKYTAFLAQPEREISEETRLPDKRADGWLEMELGEYFCDGEEDVELEMICCEINSSGKCGIIVQGIEVRPKSN